MTDSERISKLDDRLIETESRLSVYIKLYETQKKEINQLWGLVNNLRLQINRLSEVQSSIPTASFSTNKVLELLERKKQIYIRRMVKDMEAAEQKYNDTEDLKDEIRENLEEGLLHLSKRLADLNKSLPGKGLDTMSDSILTIVHSKKNERQAKKKQ